MAMDPPVSARPVMMRYGVMLVGLIVVSEIADFGYNDFFASNRFYQPNCFSFAF